MSETNATEVLTRLLAPEESTRSAAWELFLFNVPLVRLITPLVDEKVAKLIIEAGAAWTTTSWTTSSAAKTIHHLTNVAFVSQDFAMYRSSFLFALSIWWNVDVPLLELAPGAAEAAFGLQSCFTGEEGMMVENSQDEGSRVQATQNAAEEERLPWDIEEEPLPKELKVIWKRVQAGDRRFEVRELLDSVPQYDTLQKKAFVNNHRGDGASAADRTAKAHEQSLLNLLRALATVFSGINVAEPEDLQCLLGQAWNYLAEITKKVQDQRK